MTHGHSFPDSQARPDEPIEAVSPSRGSVPPTITCPPSVVSSTPFDCTLTIVTAERAPDAGALLRVTVPPGIFHLANSADVRFDADTRQLALPLDRAPRGPYSVSISLIADEAGVGRTRTMAVSMPIDTPVEEDVKTPREPARVSTSASILVAPGEPVIVSVFDSPRTPLIATGMILIAMVAALWALRIRRRRRGGRRVPSESPSKEAIGAAAIGAIVSLFLLFVCMPACFETVRARAMFVATTCTVVDRGSAGFAPEITYIPMAIVRYDADGRTRISSGFDVRGTMYGSNDPDASRLFTAGGQYPCWYDPLQPQRVILRQGPSAVVWFALVPAAVLALSLGALLGVFRD